MNSPLHKSADDGHTKQQCKGWGAHLGQAVDGLLQDIGGSWEGDSAARRFHSPMSCMRHAIWHRLPQALRLGDPSRKSHESCTDTMHTLCAQPRSLVLTGDMGCMAEEACDAVDAHITRHWLHRSPLE